MVNILALVLLVPFAQFDADSTFGLDDLDPRVISEDELAAELVEYTTLTLHLGAPGFDPAGVYGDVYLVVEGWYDGLSSFNPVATAYRSGQELHYVLTDRSTSLRFSGSGNVDFERGRIELFEGSGVSFEYLGQPYSGGPIQYRINCTAVGGSGGGITLLEQAADVNVSSATYDGVILASWGGYWSNVTLDQILALTPSPTPTNTPTVTPTNTKHPLDSHSGVVITNPQANDSFIYDGYNWINGPVSGGAGGGIEYFWQAKDSIISGTAPGQMVAYDENGNLRNVTPVPTYCPPNTPTPSNTPTVTPTHKWNSIQSGSAAIFISEGVRETTVTVDAPTPLPAPTPQVFSGPDATPRQGKRVEFEGVNGAVVNVSEDEDSINVQVNITSEGTPLPTPEPTYYVTGGGVNIDHHLELIGNEFGMWYWDGTDQTLELQFLTPTPTPTPTNTIAPTATPTIAAVDVAVAPISGLAGSNVQGMLAYVDQIMPRGIRDASDVNDATPAIGQVLKWNGNEFAPADDNSSTEVIEIPEFLGDLADVTASASGTGDVLRNNDGTFEPFSGVWHDNRTNAGNISTATDATIKTGNLQIQSGAILIDVTTAQHSEIPEPPAGKTYLYFRGQSVWIFENGYPRLYGAVRDVTDDSNTVNCWEEAGGYICLVSGGVKTWMRLDTYVNVLSG